MSQTISDSLFAPGSPAVKNTPLQSIKALAVHSVVSELPESELWSK